MRFKRVKILFNASRNNFLGGDSIVGTIQYGENWNLIWPKIIISATLVVTIGLLRSNLLIGRKTTRQKRISDFLPVKKALRNP